MYGAYETIDNRPALRFERRLSHAIDVVWRAITSSDELVHWFPSRVQVDELRPGAEMTFRFESMPIEGAPTTISGRVTEFEPPRLFAFYWGDDLVRFELEPAAETACVLRLTVLLDSREKPARDGAGWHVCLDRLEARLSGATFEGSDGEDWRGLYEEYERRGVPTGAPLPGD